MDVNPYEPPQQPDGRQRATRERLPLWRIMLDIVLVAVVGWIIFALLLPA